MSKGNVIALVPALALLVPAAWGQMPMAMTRHYDPATATTLKGTVEEVSEIRGPGNWRIVRMLVKSDAETADVHVGPAAFLKEKQFALSKGEPVEVTGSKVTVNGRPLIIAREISSGGKHITLRDSDGIPLWSRGGMPGAGMGAMMGGGRGMMNGRGMMRGRGMMGETGRKGTAESGTAPGERVFEAHCAMCHETTSTKKAGPGLKGLFQRGKLANGKPASEQNIVSVIDDGGRGMPPFADVLTRQQMQDLVAYLRQL